MLSFIHFTKKKKKKKMKLEESNEGTTHFSNFMYKQNSIAREKTCKLTKRCVCHVNVKAHKGF